MALSSTEAEYRALVNTTTEIAWLESMYSELGLHFITTPVIWCDNVSVGALAANLVFHARTKHIEIEALYIIEQVLAKRIAIQYIPSKLQIADLLTKALSTSQFSDLRKKLQVFLFDNCKFEVGVEFTDSA